MGVFRVCMIGLVLLVGASCGSGSPFRPAVGPFSGEFIVEGQVVGDFTLTTTGGLLGGTGSLTHNEQTVNVSISATITGLEISGTVSNASLGSGSMVGLFSDQFNLSGEFNYQDNGGISTTAGTWTASTLPGDGN